MIETLQNYTLEEFAEENDAGAKGAYMGSEWRPYNLDTISYWISIRDDYSYVEDYVPGNWIRLDIKKSHSKYGTNYIYLENEQKLWRIRQTADEFYSH